MDLHRERRSSSGNNNSANIRRPANTNEHRPAIQTPINITQYVLDKSVLYRVGTANLTASLMYVTHNTKSYLRFAGIYRRTYENEVLRPHQLNILDQDQNIMKT